MEIKIFEATDEDMVLIKKYVKQFKLDPENLQREQFIVAKHNDKLVGFGRLKSYSDCVELGAIGVVPKYRNKGIGKKIIDELIKIGPENIYITTDIPEYFYQFGFKIIKDGPNSIVKKCKTCTIRDNIVALKLYRE